MPQPEADTPAQAPRKVALVTGASRGIGKAIAVELANAGYDVAIIARTVHEGEAREHSSTLKRSDTSPLPGSLDATSALIQAAGARCVALQADLLDHPSLVHAAATVLAEWGHVDVLVNNGRYIGPGHMDHILDTPVRVLRDHLEANALAPVVLVKEVVPQMIERGGGTVINITSTVAYEDPPEPAGAGGWGLGYAFSKGALHRIAGILAVELRDSNVRAYNVQPGFIATERMQQDMGAFGFDASTGAPVEVMGKVCRWLLESPDAPAHNGQNIQAQPLCSRLGLLPGWSLDA
jgi:NAD(P)-dependent dehydrogenase (short-subunit alcohol dehydrogenase family)